MPDNGYLQLHELLRTNYRANALQVCEEEINVKKYEYWEGSFITRIA